MNKLLTLVFVCVMALLAANVYAAETPLSCTPPTHRADGTVLQPNEIERYKVYWALKGQTLTNQTTKPDCNESVVTGLPLGTVEIGLSTVDTAGKESVLSTIIEKKTTGSVPPTTIANPNPPTDVRIGDESSETGESETEGSGSNTSDTGDSTEQEGTSGFSKLTKPEFQSLTRSEQRKYSEAWRAAGKPAPFYKAGGE